MVMVSGLEKCLVLDLVLDLVLGSKNWSALDLVLGSKNLLALDLGSSSLLVLEMELDLAPYPLGRNERISGPCSQARCSCSKPRISGLRLQEGMCRCIHSLSRLGHHYQGNRYTTEAGATWSLYWPT